MNFANRFYESHFRLLPLTLGLVSIALIYDSDVERLWKSSGSSSVLGPTSTKFREKTCLLSLSLPLHSFDSKLLQDVNQHSQEHSFDHSQSLYHLQSSLRLESHFRTRSRGLDKPNFTSQLPASTTRGEQTALKLDHCRISSGLRPTGSTHLRNLVVSQGVFTGNFQSRSLRTRIYGY